jgi:hypothetical protein
MSPRRRKVLAISLVAPLTLAAACVALLVGRITKPAEPSCDGKTVSQWFAEFSAARQKYQTGEFHVDNLRAWLADPSTTALHALGTNAVPYLEYELRDDGSWARAYGRFFHKLPWKIRRVIPSPPLPRLETRLNAAVALGALGTSGAHAVLMLIGMCGEAHQLGGIDIRLRESLHRLPWSPEAFDPVLKQLCSRNEFVTAVSAVQYFGLSDRQAAITLTNALLTPGSRARQAAADELPRFGHQSPIAVPALMSVTSPGTTNSQELRYSAIRALEAFGTNAISALPALITVTNDSNIMVQHVALRILDNLNSAQIHPTQ